MKLEINCDNAAFGSGSVWVRADEVARILQDAANQLQTGVNALRLVDSNGNTVGTCEFKGD
jgi:hypothetical protein